MGDLLEQQTAMAALLELSRLVSSSLDLNEVLSRVIAAVGDLSGAETITIMLLDERGENLTVAASQGIDPQTATDISLRLGEGIAGWVTLNNQPLQVINPQHDPRYKRITTDRQRAIFSLPLHVRDHTLGALNLARTSSAEPFSLAVTQMVEIFASHAAIAISNAASAAALRYAATRERITSIVSQMAHAPGGALSVGPRILAELGAALEADYCAILAHTHAAYTPLALWPQAPLASAAWEPGELPLDHGERINPDSCDIYALVLAHGQEPAWLIARSLRADRYWQRAEHDLLRFAADQIALMLASERLISAEQRSRELSATLSQLANASNAMIDQERVLDFILEQLARFVPYDSAGVFLIQDSRYSRLVAGRGFRFDRKLAVVLTAGPGSPDWLSQHHQHATYIPDVQQIDDWQSVPDSNRVRSWIGVPLIVNGAVIGVLTIDKWAPRAFAAAEVQVAQMFGDHLSVAINNARLLRDAQTRASQIQVLHRLSSELSAISDEQHLLAEVAELLHCTFGYYQVVVGLVEGDQLVLRAARGAVNDVAEFGVYRSYSVARGLTGWVSVHGETILVNDVAQDPRYALAPTLEETRAELIVAIRHSETILGVIDIESDQSGIFNQSDVYLAESLAGQVAVALANIRRYEELRATQKQLVHSERLRALGELSSGIAHDFNNLLTSILGHAQLLLLDTVDPIAAEGLRIIEQAAIDGATSVRRLQNFAQVNRSLPDQEVRIDEIIDESLAITRPRWRDGMQSRGLQLKITRQLGSLPPMIGDGPALRDLMTNLILNALDAMPEGGELRLRTQLLDGPEPFALAEIADSGVGMSPEVRQRIFDPFFSTKGPNGTGMGLAMAYGIVQRHQGTISVESAPGQGTIFHIRLPIRRLPLPDPSPQPTAGEHQPLRILIVEDDDAVRQVLAQLLRRSGHAVVDIASARQALDLLDGQPFDLLCSDLGMPEMSGWELIATARERHAGLQVLLITGWGEQISGAEARLRGADAVVTKPFDAARLRELLATFHRRPGWGRPVTPVEQVQ